MNLRKIAKTIVSKNLSIKRKNAVLIDSGPNSLRFAELLATECSLKGAQPSIIYVSDRMALDTYSKINKKFLKDKPKIASKTWNMIDVEIILDDSNPFIASRLPQGRIEIRRKTLKPLKEKREKLMLNRKIKIALVGYPNKDLAKALGTSNARLNKLFWNAMTVNYDRMYRDIFKLSRIFKGRDKIRIIGDKTDLTLSIKNRHPIMDSGIIEKESLWYMNIPAGEVFFAPVETSANGEIYFDLPCMWHYGKQVHGVWFKFRNGKVVKYKINKGLKAFESVMKNASGDKYQIAELGIGMNPNAKPTGGMTIVDEKVKGTIHMAIGANKGFGGKGDSTIHWDFFKSMKPGGRVFLDGKLIHRNGKWLV